MRDLWCGILVFVGAMGVVIAGVDEDRAAILRAFESWNRGWQERDAALAVRDYADDVDWTNAFGDRLPGQAGSTRRAGVHLRSGIRDGRRLSVQRVPDITFLAADVAMVRSKLVRKGQRSSTGEVMPDRRMNHLRVLQKREGRWVIVSHMISQAREKS